MPDPSTLRDSTQIVLPASELEGLEAELQSEFTVTVYRLNGSADSDSDGDAGDPGEASRDGDGSDTATAGDADGADSDSKDDGATAGDPENDGTGSAGDDGGGDEAEVVEYVRIIGSPVVIKEVSNYLTRHGVSLP